MFSTVKGGTMLVAKNRIPESNFFWQGSYIPHISSHRRFFPPLSTPPSWSPRLLGALQDITAAVPVASIAAVTLVPRRIFARVHSDWSWSHSKITQPADQRKGRLETPGTTVDFQPSATQPSLWPKMGFGGWIYSALIYQRPFPYLPIYKSAVILAQNRALPFTSGCVIYNCGAYL